MTIVKYIYDYNCFFCRFLEPYIDQLDVYDDLVIKKIQWNNNLEINSGLPCFIVNGETLIDQIVLSSLLTREVYPELFNFESNIEFLYYMLKNPKKLPKSFDIKNNS
jgi:hypothetical protein